MENLVIRKVKIEDADEMNRILNAITKSADKTDFRQIIKEQVIKDDEASFVAEVNGKVVGFMISYILYGGFGVEKSAWIATLGVDSKFMGQGIGKRLAEEIFKVYKDRGITHIFTSVSWDSGDILSFFKTLGFDRSSFINLGREIDL